MGLLFSAAIFMGEPPPAACLEQRCGSTQGTPSAEACASWTMRAGFYLHFCKDTSAGMFNAMSVQPLVAAERVVFYRGMQGGACTGHRRSRPSHINRASRVLLGPSSLEFCQVYASDSVPLTLLTPRGVATAERAAMLYSPGPYSLALGLAEVCCQSSVHNYQPCWRLASPSSCLVCFCRSYACCCRPQTPLLPASLHRRYPTCCSKCWSWLTSRTGWSTSLTQPGSTL